MKNIASIIIVFSFLCGLYSCNTEELQDLNINPTAANSIDPGFILAFAQLRTANSASWGQLSYQSTMIQHLASLTEFVAGDKYLYRDQTVDALWNSAYPIYLKELVNLLKLTASDPQLVNYHAIASIWKVFAMHRVTDLYGDVPYYQAGKGFLEQNFNPVYDSQDAIYADMLLELENAAEALTNSAPNPGIQDLIYQGDIDKWRKFAYSMMLRLGMRLTKVDPGMAQNWVSKAIAGGVMDGTEDTNFMRHACCGAV